jgi:Flp pilus assembly protein TadG
MMRRSPLSRDERGAALIEMALLAPVFAALFIGMVDLARAYSTEVRLEQAAQRSVENIEQTHTVQTSYASYATEAANSANAAGYTGSTGTVDYWLECNGVRQSDTTTPCSTGQTYARYVKITVSNTYTPLFPSQIWPGANAQGNIPLKGSAGVRVQ